MHPQSNATKMREQRAHQVRRDFPGCEWPDIDPEPTAKRPRIIRSALRYGIAAAVAAIAAMFTLAP